VTATIDHNYMTNALTVFMGRVAIALLAAFVAACVPIAAVTRLDSMSPEPPSQTLVNMLNKSSLVGDEKITFTSYIPLDGALSPLIRNTPRGKSASTTGRIAFVVDGTGAVTDVETIESDNEEVGREVTRRVALWRFETIWSSTPTKRVRFELPYKLRVDN
jgi:hypothetical protein